MAQITISLPALQGKKTYFVGLASVLAGVAQIFHDIGTGTFAVTDLYTFLATPAAQQIITGLGLIFLRSGVTTEAKKANPTQG